MGNIGNCLQMKCKSVFFVALVLSSITLFAQEEGEINDDLGDLFEEDKVDQWEAVPLPPPPSEADLMKDSDELYSMHQSDAKNALDSEERLILQAIIKKPILDDEERELEGIEAFLNEEEAFEEPAAQKTEAKGVNTVGYEAILPVIFNTDDFDDEFDDVPGDSPFAPPLS